MFVGWFDSQFAVTCDFRRAADDEYRCLPYSHGDLGTEAFIDSACSTLVFVPSWSECESTDFYLQAISAPADATCQKTAWVVRGLGPAAPTSSTFYKSGNACFEQPGLKIYRPILAAVSAGEFVASGIEVDP